MAQSTDDIYNKAVDLAKSQDENFLDLGKSLRNLLSRDPDLFKKAIEKSDIEQRKAYYLVNISEYFEPLQCSRARLRKIGWTKLQVIGPQVNQDNVEELLDLAESHSTRQLTDIMRGGKPVKNAHCVLMYFDPKSYKELEDILVQYGAKKNGRGMLDKEKALLSALRKLKQVGG